MERCSEITVLTGTKHPLQKGREPQFFNSHFHLENRKIDNFLDDLPKLFEELFSQPYKGIIQFPTIPTNANKTLRRQKEILLTDITYSDICAVDIDDLIGEGETIEEQIRDIIDRTFPVEWKNAKMVVKLSSSYYTKGASKFHVFFKLKQPVQFSSWKAYVMDRYNFADEKVLGNSSQILYCARPYGYLKNSEFTYFAWDGDELDVDTSEYVPISEPTTCLDAKINENIVWKDGEITKPRIIHHLNNLDVNDGSYGKAFSTYRLLLAEGYQGKLAEPLIDGLNARGNTQKGYIQKQLQATEAYIGERCKDKFFEEPLEIEGYLELPPLSENKGDDEVIVNLIKGTTGVGKTHALKKIIDGSFLIASPTILLVEQNAKKFNGLPVHSGVDGLENQVLHGEVSTTIQSLHRLQFQACEGFDYFFIDEAAQSLYAILSQDSSKTAQNILDTLNTLFTSCRYIILADADLTENTIKAYSMALEGREIVVC